MPEIIIVAGPNGAPLSPGFDALLNVAANESRRLEITGMGRHQRASCAVPELHYRFNFRCRCGLELGKRALLSRHKYVPGFDDDASSGQFVNSSVVVCLLRVKQRLHGVDNLILPVPFTLPPSTHKVFGFLSISLGAHSSK